jgi:hypothetical protein
MGVGRGLRVGILLLQVDIDTAEGSAWCMRL